VSASEVNGGDGRVSKPASGIPAKGASKHGPDCPCTRCQGWPRTVQGAYAGVELARRAGEVADGIRGLMIEGEVWRSSFEPTVQATAVVLERLRRAEAALEEIEQRLELEAEASGSLVDAYLNAEKAGALHWRLRQDARGWANTLRGYLNDLGLSPAALARISRDSGMGRAARASAALRALEEHVEREYGPREGEG
jgi:hypothetical protein